MEILRCTLMLMSISGSLADSTPRYSYTTEQEDVFECELILPDCTTSTQEPTSASTTSIWTSTTHLTGTLTTNATHNITTTTVIPTVDTTTEQPNTNATSTTGETATTITSPSETSSTSHVTVTGQTTADTTTMNPSTEFNVTDFTTGATTTDGIISTTENTQTTSNKATEATTRDTTTSGGDVTTTNVTTGTTATDSSSSTTITTVDNTQTTTDKTTEATTIDTTTSGGDITTTNVTTGTTPTDSSSSITTTTVDNTQTTTGKTTEVTTRDTTTASRGSVNSTTNITTGTTPTDSSSSITTTTVDNTQTTTGDNTQAPSDKTTEATTTKVTTGTTTTDKPLTTEAVTSEAGLCPVNMYGQKCQFIQNEIMTERVIIKMGVSVRLTNQQFSPELSNNLSEAFRSFERRFNQQMEELYKNIPNYKGIRIRSIKNGSVIVEHDVLAEVKFETMMQEYNQSCALINATLNAMSCTSLENDPLCFSAGDTAVCQQKLDESGLCSELSSIPREMQQYFYALPTKKALLCVTPCSTKSPHPVKCIMGQCFVSQSGPSCYCDTSERFWYTGERCQTTINKAGVYGGVTVGLAVLLIVIVLLSIFLHKRHKAALFYKWRSSDRSEFGWEKHRKQSAQGKNPDHMNSMWGKN
eukprot:XP_017946044.1 PREDICTED: mucin-17-like isoform X2 [Xenopus tropicalis]